MKRPGYVEYEKPNVLKIILENSDMLVKVSETDFSNNLLNNIINYERIIFIDSSNKKIYFDENADSSNISIEYELIEVKTNGL
ncbi:hypothetical protein ACTQ54_05010 [Fundicoccus sp. Sow4_H7]|uniref:hypothetical protein n=1 Tax=Fundicoccus sp. Sow4_H7 TaxID=3438784 RepID=UPI003F920AA3